ncbi:unnamed protein product, partial [Didymodactylos carnosus]
ILIEAQHVHNNDDDDDNHCSVNICQNNGQCYNYTTSNNTPVCICQKCYTGEQCEYNNNIIRLSLASAMLTDIHSTPSSENGPKSAYIIVTTVLCLISIVNNLICLQIFISRGIKRRSIQTRTKMNVVGNTNVKDNKSLGDNRIYLILYCFYSLIAMLELESRVILMLNDQRTLHYQFYSCNIAPVFSTMMIHLTLDTVQLEHLCSLLDPS